MNIGLKIFFFFLWEFFSKSTKKSAESSISLDNDLVIQFHLILDPTLNFIYLFLINIWLITNKVILKIPLRIFSTKEIDNRLELNSFFLAY